jgi:ubiquinone/menaquinone biosynthesis C-methylase UbiE
MTDSGVAPNHHAHHAPFTGIVGVVAALSMVTGRDADARLAIELTGLTAGELALDVGCGPGAAVRRAAELGATAIGVDPAPVMLRTARLLTRHGAASYRRGTAEKLPLDGDVADAAWSVATVHHWKDVDAGLREVRRVLRTGGRFAAIERRTVEDARGLASHGWRPEQAEAFAARAGAAGFVDVRIEEHPGARGTALAAVMRR